ncbi:MAG: DUF4932 domain-containing protein [Phycisphaerales bacterium]|nr:DUF4932 domain-containing protein [Phycisphaerales bacterium]
MKRAVSSALSILLAAFLSLLCGPIPQVAAAEPAPFPVRVDPRVEIVMTIFRLAGADEFNMENSVSPYSKAIDVYFASFKDHPAVKAVEKLRSEHSIGFNAVPDLAVRLKDYSSGDFLVPIDPLPVSMDKRWTPDAARSFAALVRDFARDTNYAAFLEQQRPFFEKSEAAFAALLAVHPFRQLIEDFFGEPIAEGSYAIPGLLAGGGNYGMSITFPDGRLVVTPIIGISNWKADSTPQFDDRDVDTVVHEFCHPFANPLVDLHAADLVPAAEMLHTRHAQSFAAQAYSTPKTVMYESLVRACVVQLMKHAAGPDRSLFQRKQEIGRSFWFTPALTAALDRYEASRDKYPTLRSFMPEIVAALKDAKAVLAAEEAKVPHVVSIQPADGSTDVPRDVEFIFVFDRTMDKTSRGLSFEGDVQFERIVGGSFSDNGKTYRTVLRLPSHQTIKARLNANGSGLAGVEGHALEPVEFMFSTAK